jgi:hypothetical protein
MKLNYTEAESFNLLRQHFPDIQKNGARKRLKEAYEWVQGYAEISNWDTEELKSDMIPPFIPDGTRLIKLENDDKERDFILQFWEIENKHPVCDDKLERLHHWLFREVDPYDVGVFELWRCDKWGGGHRRLFSNIDWYLYKGYENYEELNSNFKSADELL